MQSSCFEVFLCSYEVKKPSLEWFNLIPQQELEIKRKNRDTTKVVKNLMRIFVASQHSRVTLLANLTEVILTGLCFKQTLPFIF